MAFTKEALKRCSLPQSEPFLPDLRIYPYLAFCRVRRNS
jgi:hypothetical protein